jgi:thiol-disulfide isomerase/thioredoxin
VRVCLQPSDKLELNIDNTTGTITLLNGSAANQILHQWSELIRPITDYGYNLAAIKDSVSIDEYMSTYNKLEPAMDEFVNSFHFAHPDLQSAMKIDKDLAPINLLFQSSAKKIHGFRLTPKDFNEVPDFYQQFIESSKFNSASILTIGEARQYMNLYARLNAALVAQQTKVELPKAEKLRVMMNSIENDTLKSYLFNDQMWEMGANNLSEFNQRFEPHKKYAKRAPAKDSYQSIYNQFGGDTAYIGKSSYNFSLPDTNGKMVSMKDFKGKVILIDVWATWCGPCKGEMPYLKTIEEEYKNNKDIVFVAISLDKAKDKQRWLNYIQKENLPGVHLLDDLGLAFGRKYHVTAIPRYLMIDKKGNWIEVRCPNPSSTEDLKRYIDDALKQKA